MKGLTRNQIHQIKESLELATFSRKWWKMLRKEMNKFSLPAASKQMVLVKIAKGLIDEAQEMCKCNEDEVWLKAFIKETMENE